MVNSIICPPNQTKCSPMYVRDFNDKFKEHFKEDFKTISGVDISKFADKNILMFETSVDKRHRMMIQAKARKMSKKKRHKKEIPNKLNQSGKSEDLYETDYVTAESDQLTEETSDEDSTDELSEETFLESNKERPNLKLSLSDSDDYDKDFTESPREKWTEVRRQRNRTPASGHPRLNEPQDQQQKHQEIQVQYQRALSEEEQQYLLSKLLQKKESHDFIMNNSAENYINHPYKLAIDLVSLWNTPARTLSYIVVCLDQSLNLSILSEYLSLKNFTTLPHFQYFEVDFTDACYGIFELPSSHGSGQPAITKSTLTFSEASNVCWERDQLWIRKSVSQVALSLSDPLVAMIYQWFAGDNGSSTKSKPDRETKDRNGRGSTRKQSESPSEMTKNPLEIFRKPNKEFKKGKYILLAGNIPTGIKNLEAISTVPWMYVFDFDQTSRDSGLLSVNENFIRK